MKKSNIFSFVRKTLSEFQKPKPADRNRQIETGRSKPADQNRQIKTGRSSGGYS
jgi:hypothetical protein